LRGGEGNHFDLIVLAKRGVEVMKIAASRAHDEHALAVLLSHKDLL
jgi:hypothetical protein